MVNSKALQARAEGLKIQWKEVAIKTGISQSALSKKIHNARSMTLQEAEKIAEVLKIEPRFWMGYFFGREGGNGLPDKKPAPIPAIQLDGLVFTEEQKEVVRVYRNLDQKEKLIIAALLGVFRNIDLRKVDFNDLVYHIGEELY